MDETYFVSVARGSIGRLGKPIEKHTLVLGSEYIQLFESDEQTAREYVINNPIPKYQRNTHALSPFRWKDITGLDLSYKPMSLHKLVIEVPTKRTRETNNSEIEDNFFVVFFGTKDLAIIEEQIQAHNLKDRVREGISDILSKRPFCILYSVTLRKIVNFTANVSQVFVTICIFVAIFQWLMECTPPKGQEECVSILGGIILFVSGVINFFLDFLQPYLVMVMNWLNSVPLVKYPLLLFSFLFALPLYLWGLILWTIMYLSKLALMAHAFMFVLHGMMFASLHFKIFSSSMRYFVQICQFLWMLIFKIWCKYLKPQKRSPVLKPSPETKKEK
eukprot:TRINITY_DN5015_c0_g1_i4.p1 TRINITY_DN5015_c0_g1~~TRINITY_DN5015_c0_g1_i4.p1  ORF type:complete len:332 (+),score=36.72 TRINITY_DN5015_c0_g1_i4:120-1115(+)